MKFTINIECSPEEAREFLAIPDPEKVQEMMMKAMTENMQGQMPDMPDNFTDGMKHWQNVQQMFLKQMMTPMGTNKGASDSGADSGNKKSDDK